MFARAADRASAVAFAEDSTVSTEVPSRCGGTAPNPTGGTCAPDVEPVVTPDIGFIPASTAPPVTMLVAVSVTVSITLLST
ncbi:hypothetical protein ACQEVI_17145 [Promicromonospora sp. CA-289599]|uniref:hypothetical protein n=1 Tax=Promicromonospora sp. CA-289599 TaxID=3240014 RepID=UPI003D8E1C51